MSLVSGWSQGSEPLPGYVLTRRLGRGGMGEVWEALAPGGVPVALKRVALKDACGQREQQALELFKRVRHPHLLAINGVWTVGTDLIVGLELADESLHSVLQKHREGGSDGVPQERLLELLHDAAEALDYLGRPVHRMNGHTVRIQHRDVKPANLLLQGGAVKVADFGLAKALQDIVADPSYSMTPAYAPPEFFRGDTSPTSDQYSLAVSYYQLRTGRLPYSGTPELMMQGHLHREPDLTGLTDVERAIVVRALAKNADMRWANCVKFIGEISRSGNGTVVHHIVGPDQKDALVRSVKFQGREITSGMLLISGDLVSIPLKRTDVRVVISAAAAEVIVVQSFVNTHQRAVEATYVFPLPENAAVHSLLMHVGERTIEGVVYEKREARATYEEAKVEGHGAALVEQSSPNIFTSSVANILPGQTIRVEIRYVQVIPFDEGQYRFVFPMVVAPRYVLGSEETVDGAQHAVSSGGARVPSGLLRGDVVDLQIDLDGGVPLCGFDSPSHDLDVTEDAGSRRVRLALRRSDEIPNRDFVLTYRVSGPRLEHAMLYEPGEKSEPGTFLMVTTPPRGHAQAVLGREFIFVLDRSGSMHGAPLQQAKQAAQQLLSRLDLDDAFNILAFDTSVTSLSPSSLAADPANLRQGHAFLEQLHSGGGTEMQKPLDMALTMPVAPGQERLRMVVFLTDGSVTGERGLLEAVRPKIGRTRIVAFGIGTAVNRHLVNKLSAAGRGFAEFLFPGENIARAVDRTLRRLAHPVLTEVELEWTGGRVDEVQPERCPDVYRDQPLVVLGRFHGPAPPALIVHGKAAGVPYQAALDATETRRYEGDASLATLWARGRIEELMDRIWESPQLERELRAEVIALAKRYGLTSNYTSLLAVEYRSKTERERAIGAVSVDVPLYMPKGMPAAAPSVSLGADQAMLSTPESRTDALRGRVRASQPRDYAMVDPPTPPPTMASPRASARPRAPEARAPLRRGWSIPSILLSGAGGIVSTALARAVLALDWPMAIAIGVLMALGIFFGVKALKR